MFSSVSSLFSVFSSYLASLARIRHSRVVNALAALTPSRPDLSGFTQLANMSSVLQWEGLTLQFDGTTGALIHLLDATTGFNWASGSSPFAQIQYQTWSETGYSPSAHVCDAVLGGKPGSAEAGPEDATWLPQMKQLFVSADRSQIVVNLSMPEETVAKYGGFPEVRASTVVLACSLFVRPNASSIVIGWYLYLPIKLAMHRVNVDLAGLYQLQPELLHQTWPTSSACFHYLPMVLQDGHTFGRELLDVVCKPAAPHSVSVGNE